MHDLDAVAKDTGLGKARTTVRHTRGGGPPKGGTYSGACQVIPPLLCSGPHQQLGFSHITRELLNGLTWEQSDTSVMGVYFFPLPLDSQLTQAPRIFLSNILSWS